MVLSAAQFLLGLCLIVAAFAVGSFWAYGFNVWLDEKDYPHQRRGRVETVGVWWFVLVTVGVVGYAAWAVGSIFIK